jgi:hypothetical protein
MTTLQYPVFYRNHGIRRIDQLIKPPLSRLELLNLPRNSVYHYLGTGPLDDGPTETENAIKDSTKPFTIETITDLKSLEGNPRKLLVDINRAARSHRAKNPRFRPFKTIESAVRDPQSILVCNYSYIHRLYKYLRNYYAAHYKWTNLISTVFSRVAEITSVCDRHQFIEFDLPKTLPSLTQLRQAERAIDQKSARIFSTSETVILLQVWEWLGSKRNKSVISKIPADKLDRVNLIFRESGRWFVLNLGQINNWRAATKEELSKDSNLNTRGHPSDRIQKLFLRLEMSLFEARTGVVVEPTHTEEDTTAPAAVSKVQETASGVGTIVDDSFNQNLDDEDDIVPEADNSEPETPEDIAQVDAQVDADLETLENIGPVTDEHDIPEDQEVFDISTVIPTGQTLEDDIIARCNTLADSGGLSAAEYRKYLEIAGTYKTITAPDGSTMDKFIQITKELTTIVESPSIPDKATVIDKTMLKSSLMEFDERYIKNVMQKDIAGMVMNLQKAGMIVLDYQVETIENVSMAYNSYTVKVKPLQGVTSTLRFRIPKVNESGTFRVNNVNYTSRKQKGD